MTLDTAELTLDITEGDPAPVAYLNVQAPNDYFFLIWTSSDPAVASVDGTGKVTGRAEGAAVITACSEHKRYRKGAGVRQGRHQRTDHSRAGAALHGNGHIGDRTGADEQKRHAAAGSGSQSEADRAGCRHQKRNDDMDQQQSRRGNCECGWHGNGGGRW